MVKKPKAILIDLDGTLVDNTELVAETYYECMVELGMKPLPLEVIMQFSGKSTYDTAKSMGVPPDKWGFVDAFFWKRFYEKITSQSYEIKIIKGAEKFLRECQTRNIPLGVVTSNNRKNAITVLKKASLLDYIDVLVAKDDVIRPKPHPEPLLKALSLLQISHFNHDEIWYIGDSESDRLAAKNAGVFFIKIGEHSNSSSSSSSSLFKNFHSLIKKVC